MTKTIRVENADTAAFKVNVKVMDRGHNGAPDKLVEVISLGYPTAMTPPHTYITDSRYLVVEEEQRVSKERRVNPHTDFRGSERRITQRRK